MGKGIPGTAQYYHFRFDTDGDGILHKDKQPARPTLTITQTYLSLSCESKVTLKTYLEINSSRTKKKLTQLFCIGPLDKMLIFLRPCLYF